MKNFTAGLLMGFAALSTQCVFAQANSHNVIPDPYKKSFWFDLGLGWGGQGGAANVGFSYEMIPGRIISIHYSPVWTNDHCDEVVLFFPIENPLGKRADALEISYGIVKKRKVSMLTLSAGLSYVKVETSEGSGPSTQGIPILYQTGCPDNYTVKDESTIGLALRAQFIPSIRWGGIGISPYLNINPKYTFASFTINAALGRMKPRS
jgi:hypothetical protein